MKFLLDTNAWIDCLNHATSAIKNKLAILDPTSVVICSVVKAELFFGVHNSRNPEKNLAKLTDLLCLFESLPFDDRAASVFGEIRFHLSKIGQLIGPYDLQIAAIAIANNLTVVTHNIKEFSRVPKLQIEDWQ